MGVGTTTKKKMMMMVTMMTKVMMMVIIEVRLLSESDTPENVFLLVRKFFSIPALSHDEPLLNSGVKADIFIFINNWYSFDIKFCILFIGSVWVYPNYGKLKDVDFKQCSGNVTDGCLEKICNKDLMTFAFASVTIDWLFMGLFIGLIAYYMVNTLCKVIK